ncbi:MAG: ferrochelatase, partial [Vulcanimicrobiaceae bacterium]
MIAPPTTHYDGVLLLGFGGPSAPDQIRPFLDRVLDGRRIPPARYEEVVAHYIRIGGKSPYNDLTQQQADAIARSLRERGLQTPVEIAYRHVEPFVDDVVGRLAREHARHVFAIVLSPHQSAASWDKYVAAAQDACGRIGSGAPHIDYIDPYFEHPLFIRAHVERINDARARFEGTGFDDVHLIFTAHSIPLATMGAGIYVQQLGRSAELIA